MARADVDQSEAVRPWRATRNGKNTSTLLARRVQAGMAAGCLLLCLLAIALKQKNHVSLQQYIVTHEAEQQESLSMLALDSSSPLGSAELRLACRTCAASILFNHLPWDAESTLDPEDAMSCSREGICSAAADRAADLSLNRGQQIVQGQELSQQVAGAQYLRTIPQGGTSSAGATVEGMSKEQFLYDCAELDREQLALNWRRARVFARYAGAPRESGTTYTLASWVFPLDPQGRPVPSWLSFTPTALSQFLMSEGGSAQSTLIEDTNQKIGGLEPLASVTPLSNPRAMLASPSCLEQTSCGECAAAGCQWCGGQEICSTKCAFSASLFVISKANECPGRTGSSATAAVSQEEDQQRVKSLVSLAKMTAGTPLVAAATAEDLRIKASECTLPGASGGPSLQDSLAPLNSRQAELNSRRQMLYYRMQTGLAPGQDMDSVDNFAKPTLAWSTIGRPWTGWLHWGNDNDGGYMNPAGGTEWDASVVNPAEYGGYGKATREYIRRHPPATSLIKGGQRAGTPLFGTMDPARDEELASFGSMRTALGGEMQPVQT